MEEVIIGCFHSWSDDVPAMLWSHHTQRLAHWWSSEAVGPTGPSWCNCLTSIADSPGVVKSRVPRVVWCRVPSSPSSTKGSWKTILTLIYWRQKTGLDVEVADDAFVVRIKQRTSSIDGIRSRHAGAMWRDYGEHFMMLWAIETEHTANDFASFFSDKVASVWTSTAAKPRFEIPCKTTPLLSEWTAVAASSRCHDFFGP